MLAIDALEDKSREVRQSALLLLSESETEIAQQALWNYLPFAQMQCLHTITEFKFDSFNTKYHPDYFAIANYNNSLVCYRDVEYKRSGIAIWDLATSNAKINNHLMAHEFGLGKDGKVFVTSYQDLNFVFELETQAQIDDYPNKFICGVNAANKKFAVCRTDKPLIAKSQCTGGRGELEIWNYNTSSCLLHYKFDNLFLCANHIFLTDSKIEKESIYTAPYTFTSDGKFLIVQFTNRQQQCLIQIWDTEAAEIVQSLDSLPKLIITSVGVRPDKTIIVCGIREEKVCAWELQSDKIIHSVEEVSPCLLSTDGRVLIYATANHEIVVRDLVDERNLCKLQGHDAPIAFLALSEDRQFLASYSIDRQIKIWGIPNLS